MEHTSSFVGCKLSLTLLNKASSAALRYSGGVGDADASVEYGRGFNERPLVKGCILESTARLGEVLTGIDLAVLQAWSCIGRGKRRLDLANVAAISNRMLPPKPH